MIDELLGRAELKERVAELETELEAAREERDRAENRLDSADRRRKEAVRKRQEAEEEINRLEDRIEQLEDQVDRLRGEEADLDYRGTERLRGAATERILDRLASVAAPPDDALTAVVDGSIPEAVTEAFGDRSTLVGRASPCIAVADADGLVSAALSPPVVPEPSVTWSDRFELDRSWFLPTGSFAVALVRSDLFALGEYRGDERVAVRGFESDVHGEHSKGGFSQARFERRRDEQVAAHLDRCHDALADRNAERLYLVGDAAAIDELDVDAAATAAVGATGKPKEALEDAVREFWTTTLYRI